MKKLTTILLICFSLTIFSQETIDLFIWAGQSNALGRQGDAAQYPNDSNNLDNQIRFNWTVPNGGNSAGWTTMQAQDLGHYFPDGHFGPEVTFSRNLVQAGYNPAIFKFTQGATSIFEHWLNPGEGGLYDNMINDLNTAITTLQNQGHIVNIQGFIWIQGESDSNSQAAASAYYNNLMLLINDLRNNVVNNPNLPILLGVDEQYFNLIGHEQPEILNAHQDIALNDNTIKFTSMYGYPKADVTHLTPSGLISHGEDLFNSFQLLIANETPINNCTIIAPGNHNSFERTSWGQSFTTDCSGILSSISFESISTHNDSATFTLYNGADCSSTILYTTTLNSIHLSNNTVNLLNQSIYIDKEHTYYFDIVSDTNTPWQINFSDIDAVFGVLRCTSNDGTQNCGRTFLDYDMGFAVDLKNSSECINMDNVYNFTYDNRTYQIVKENKTWADAAACAAYQGGYLARINDANEQNAIWNELQNNSGIILANTIASNGGGASYIWIGGSDAIVEGTWIWNDGSNDQFWSGDTNGTSVNGLYTNWGNEPDNAGNQDGLSIALTQWPIATGTLGSAGQWNDLIDTDLLYYVIEYPILLNSTNLENISNNIVFYPNPVTNHLIIKSEIEIKDIKIFNIQGQLIQKLKVLNTTNKKEIDFSSIKKGVYFITINLKNGKSILKKIIK